MELEELVISLELAKKLKELKIKQESLFYHYNEPYSDGIEDFVITTWDDYETAYNSKEEPYSAFMASELAQILPTKICTKEKREFNGIDEIINYEYHIKITRFSSCPEVWHCCYMGHPVLEGHLLVSLGSSSFAEHAETMCDAIARMIIYLIENNLFVNKE